MIQLRYTDRYVQQEQGEVYASISPATFSLPVLEVLSEGKEVFSIIY